MKKFNYLLMLIGILISGSLLAQISEGGTPPSIKYQIKADNVDKITLAKPDLRKEMMEDVSADKGAYRVGKMLTVDLSMENSGTWTELPDGGKIWRLKIHVDEAKALSVYYKDFYLPKGSKLFLYNSNQKQIIGAFTSFNNPENGEFSTEMIQGEELTLEYYQPSLSVHENVYGRTAIDTKKPSISIIWIGYVYRGVDHLMNRFMDEKPPQYGSSDACQVNVNCSPEGDAWQQEKRGVAEIYLTDGQYMYFCTGSLVNNTSQDCTPYFLTADHCGETYFSYWQFYFNYESSGCTSTSQPSYNTMTGATQKASGDENTGSDFDLLLLNNSVPTNYNPYYNGWDRTGNTVTSGVSIHHPSGDIKKISTFTTQLYSATWYNCITNAHWRVYWAATTNGHGVTEGGSSGSPIFDSNHRIVGTLTGGGSYCTATSQPDYYGKFSVHWNNSGNGTTNAYKLEPWLDPTGTGATTLNGYDCTTTGVTANFSGSPTTVVEGGSVTFTDLSTGSPTSWSWSFPGGSPSSYNGQNPPAITYSTAGTYNVSLTVSDGSTNDNETKTNYITVITQGSSSCDTLRYPLSGTPTLYGASTGGYVSGNNGYDDLAKADYFDSYTPYTEIDGVEIWFGYATGSGTCRVAVWNQSGGAPGSMIGYQDVSLSTIIADVNAGVYTSVTFASPITIPGPFYVGVVLPTSAGDTVAIVTNDDGESVPNTAWEQWSDNTWYAYDDQNSWGMSMSHAISPIVCTGSTGINSAELPDFAVFPNPAKDIINIISPVDNYIVKIYNISGELIMTRDFNTNKGVIDISDYESGIYNIVINAGSKQFTKKISVLK